MTMTMTTLATTEGPADDALALTVADAGGDHHAMIILTVALCVAWVWWLVWGVCDAHSDEPSPGIRGITLLMLAAWTVLVGAVMAGAGGLL